MERPSPSFTHLTCINTRAAVLVGSWRLQADLQSATRIRVTEITRVGAGGGRPGGAFQALRGPHGEVDLRARRWGAPNRPGPNDQAGMGVRGRGWGWREAGPGWDRAGRVGARGARPGRPRGSGGGGRPAGRGHEGRARAEAAELPGRGRPACLTRGAFVPQERARGPRVRVSSPGVGGSARPSRRTSPCCRSSSGRRRRPRSRGAWRCRRPTGCRWCGW